MTDTITTEELWQLLEHAKITITSVTPDAADFYVGPQIRVMADLLTTDGQSGMLAFYMALNPGGYQPVLVNFIITDSTDPIPPERFEELQERSVQWHHVVGERDIIDEVEQLTTRIVCLLLMNSIEGYTEHAAQVRQSFRDFADL